MSRALFMSLNKTLVSEDHCRHAAIQLEEGNLTDAHSRGWTCLHGVPRVLIRHRCRFLGSCRGEELSARFHWPPPGATEQH